MVRRSSLRLRVLIGGCAVLALLGVGLATSRSADAAGHVKLGNRVWEDTNGNGRQDSGEPGIDGAVVRIYSVGSTGDRYLGKRTTVRGWWAAYVPAGGCYRIRVEAPDGYTPTQQDVGSDRFDSDISKWGHTHRRCISGDDYSLDAGYVPPEEPEPEGPTITFYQDLNRDGVRDGNEPNAPDGAATVTLGLYAGWLETPGEITVDVAEGVATLPATWDPYSNGNETPVEAVLIERTTAGRISVPPPAHFDDQTLSMWGDFAHLDVQNQGDNIDVGLAEPVGSSVFGQTFLDANSNATLDADEGVADVNGTTDIVAYPNTGQFGKFPVRSDVATGTMTNGELSAAMFLYPGECLYAVLSNSLTFDGRALSGFYPRLDFSMPIDSTSEPRSDFASDSDNFFWKVCDGDPTPILGVLPETLMA